MCFNTSFATIDEWKTYLDSNEVYLAYALETPVETYVLKEETDIIEALKTHYPQTNIYNDEGAHMVVEYVADTKNYIYKKIEAIAAAMLAKI